MLRKEESVSDAMEDLKRFVNECQRAMKKMPECNVEVKWSSSDGSVSVDLKIVRKDKVMEDHPF